MTGQRAYSSKPTESARDITHELHCQKLVFREVPEIAFISVIYAKMHIW